MRAVETQFCKGCGADRPLETFSPSFRGKSGRKCRSCVAARQRERCRTDPDFRAKNAARLKAWAGRNPGRIKASKRAHYERNKEVMDERSKKFVAENREMHREASRRWHKENRVRSYAHTRTRSLRKKGQTPPDADFNKIATIYAEAARLTRETGIKHHVDHIKPLSKGGLHHQDNLQILTWAANLSKGAKYAEESPCMTAA
jgi:5-methylcytosine-specific restriction endonuclease McrA